MDLLINRFNEFKEDIKWNKINKNRIEKLVDKIKNKDKNYELDKELKQYIKNNLSNINNNKTNKKTKDEYPIIELIKKNINLLGNLSNLESAYNDILKYGLEKNECLINHLIKKLEKTIKYRKRFSDEDARSIQRLVFIIPITPDLINDNTSLSSKIRKLETKKKEIKSLKNENKARYYLNTNYKTLDIEYQSYYRGFEMDIYIPTLKLNIEIDGEHHYELDELRKKEQLRDKMFNKDGIEVKRIRITKIKDLSIKIDEIMKKYTGNKKNNKSEKIKF